LPLTGRNSRIVAKGKGTKLGSLKMINFSNHGLLLNSVGPQLEGADKTTKEEDYMALLRKKKKLSRDSLREVRSYSNSAWLEYLSSLAVRGTQSFSRLSFRWSLRSCLENV
jgi:hypothetical protein